MPLPISRTPGVRVEYAGAQTGMQIDDVGAIISQLGFVLIQSKKNLRLETKPDTPLEKALDQVLALYLDGVPDGSGVDGAIRPVDPDRDLLVITTDISARPPCGCIWLPRLTHSSGILLTCRCHVPPTTRWKKTR